MCIPAAAHWMMDRCLEDTSYKLLANANAFIPSSWRRLCSHHYICWLSSTFHAHHQKLAWSFCLVKREWYIDSSRHRSLSKRTTDHLFTWMNQVLPPPKQRGKAKLLKGITWIRASLWGWIEFWKKTYFYSVPTLVMFDLKKLKLQLLFFPSLTVLFTVLFCSVLCCLLVTEHTVLVLLLIKD